MTYYALSNYPNQKFRTSLNDHVIEIHIHTFNGTLFIDIIIDEGEYASYGNTITANESIFPSYINIQIDGIMKFVCSQSIDVTYDKLNMSSCVLAYEPWTVNEEE